MKHFILVLFVMFSAFEISAQTGVTGIVKDVETNELLPFVNIVLKGTTKGTTTDFDGIYTLSLSPGKHTLVFSSIAYDDVEKEVEVADGQMLELNVDMGTAPFMQNTVEITAVRKKDDVAAVVKEVKEAETTKSSTSNEEMKEKAVNNVQAGVKLVTGVSADRSGDVNVRGMNARYISVGINGIVIPGTDPEKNSVQLDLIPTTMVNSIDVSKTFSPDLPGNSTGGAININLKDMPTKKFFKVSASMGVNDVTTFNPEFRTYEGGKLDWLGYDDGTRTVPNQITGEPEYIYNGYTNLLLTRIAAIRARGNDSVAMLVDDAAKSLSNQMVSTFKAPAFNRSLSIYAGDTIHVGKSGAHTRLLGYVIGGGYRMNYSYRGTQFADWDYSDSGVAYNEKFNLRDENALQTPNVNGLAGFAFEPWRKHKFIVNVMYNHSAEKSARSLEGSFPSMISSDNVYYSNTLGFIERSMINTQVMGKHQFFKGDSSFLKNVELEWAYDYFDFTQEEPDLRFFSYDLREVDTTYFISKSEYTVPAHFWRNLHDKQQTLKGDLKIPLFNKGTRKDFKNYLKFGTMYSSKTRTFGEETFLVENSMLASAFNDAEGDPTVFFGEDNMGVDIDPNGSNTVKNYVESDTDIGNSYTGIYNIFANYGMVSINPIKRLKLIGGARFENTYITTTSLDTLRAKDTVDVLDILPSINMVVRLDSAGDMQLRLSATQTVAKPTMREVAPFESFQFIGGPLYAGNSALQRTKITNYDARWEYYPRRGEMVSVAGYYKSFENAISMAFKRGASTPEITWYNVEDAKVYGAEFEYRRDLDFISEEADSGHKFNFNTNLSYIFSTSRVDTVDEAVRPFTGQSNYLANFGLGYKNKSNGWNITLSGNYFSDRLAIINTSAQMDVYERGRMALNLVAMKKVNDRLTLTFTARNILNPDVELYIKPNGVEGFEEGYIYNSYKAGRSFSIGLKYDLFGDQ